MSRPPGVGQSQGSAFQPPYSDPSYHEMRRLARSISSRHFGIANVQAYAAEVQRLALGLMPAEWEFLKHRTQRDRGKSYTTSFLEDLSVWVTGRTPEGRHVTNPLVYVMRAGEGIQVALLKWKFTSWRASFVTNDPQSFVPGLERALRGIERDFYLALGQMRPPRSASSERDASSYIRNTFEWIRLGRYDHYEDLMDFSLAIAKLCGRLSRYGVLYFELIERLGKVKVERGHSEMCWTVKLCFATLNQDQLESLRDTKDQYTDSRSTCLEQLGEELDDLAARLRGNQSTDEVYDAIKLIGEQALGTRWEDHWDYWGRIFGIDDYLYFDRHDHLDVPFLSPHAVVSR
ncbi:uncharacterized protein JCM6883_004999 [Sporobolomyces salmoneus]|uniref:uncharacterized protein n=1 Tax=Sporobolomyces salmoneus TaxID=183962 RepID=UPI00317D2915